VRIWDSENGGCAGEIAGHGDEVEWVSWSPDGSRLATASVDARTRIFDARRLALEVALPGRNRAVSVLRANARGCVAALQDDRSLTVLDPRAGRARLRLRHLQRQSLKDAAWSPDGRLLACASLDGGVVCIDAEKGEAGELLRAGCGIHALAWSPGGSLLALGLADGSVEVRDAGEGELRARYRDHGEAVYAVAFCPDGARLASACRDGVVGLRGPDGFLSLRGHGDAVVALAWAPDGSLLASASRDASIRLWSRAGEERGALRGHRLTVWDVDFTPDGRRLLSSSFDHDVRLWDLEEGRSCARVLSGHARQVGAVVALGPEHALSGSRDGTCRLWELGSGRARVLRPDELPGAEEAR
jgi:WD40 repeat protein